MSERRRYQRVPAIHLTARVGIKKGIFSRDWSTVQVVDFTRQGMAFTGDLALELGDDFQVSLKMSTDTGEFVVEKAAASVASTREHEGQPVYGVSFAEGNPEPARRVLEQIEGILNRYKEVSTRISNRRPSPANG